MTVRRLLRAGTLAHLVAAALAIAYNLIVRSALHPGSSEAVLRATWTYVLVTAALGAGVGRFLVRRLTAFAGTDVLRTGVALRRYVLWFPVARALLSTLCWLSAIPVLAVVTIRANGHVHPVGFPHFVASILIAWLVATTYSSVSNLWLALQISQTALVADAVLGADGEVLAWLRLLRRFIRALPRLALAVPVIAAAMYLLYFRPLRLAPDSGKALELFLVGLMTVSGYGWYFCRHAALRMEAMLAV